MKKIALIFFAILLLGSVSYAQKREPGKVKTLVIDPGHGGAKPGAIGAHSQEKDLVLAIAKKFGKLVNDNFPEVSVIYTRTTDVDIDLSARSNIANKAKADLFISIHANSHPTSVPCGTETFVMGLSKGKANMAVAKKENADILLEDNYKNNSAYQGFDPNSPESSIIFAMFQNAYINKSLDFAQMIQDQYCSAIKTTNRGVKQAEFMVLYMSAMPAVLTEVGFISNPEEEAFMMSNFGQASIAVSLLKAFAAYKAAEEGTAVKKDFKIDLPDWNNGRPQPVKPKEEASVVDSVAIAAVAADSVAKLAETKAPVEEPASASAPVKKDYVIYKVQFMSNESIIQPGDNLLKDISQFEYYVQNNVYKYVTGSFYKSSQAKELQDEVRKKGFKDAFVVAFYKGERITLQQAKEIIMEIGIGGED